MRAYTKSNETTATVTAVVLPEAKSPLRAPPVETTLEYQDDLGFETTAPQLGDTEHAPSSKGRPVREAPLGPERSPLDELPRSLKERFEAVTLLGEGGMGTVYRARDRKLGREVAIKLIHGADVKSAWRFLQEVRAQARIEHPHVCKIFEVGTEGALRFIVMQLVHGEPLDKAKEGMTTEQKVKVLKEAAAAVHEAHRVGFIHRDIKPSNIMVERGEDGAYKPYVMDFGLARELQAWGQTMTGAIAGTPAFMAPEQARGEVRLLDRRTDVFSLGATLYDLLAGRPPFIGGSLIELLRRVGRDEVQPIRQVNRAIPEDLETIVMKCLEREPNRRYDSARALADDLQRYLDGEPIRARRVSVGYWLVKKLRKHRLAAALSASTLAVAVVVAALWIRSARRAEEQAKLSQELGADLKEMELYMRYAYGLPLHDIEQERDIVRGRLRGIEERMARMGRAAEGPGNYALGRGYLSLREPDAALRYLRASAAAGYASPELELSLGLALGELYKKALEDTRRILDPEKKKARVRELEVELRDPALGHLRAAVGAKLEAPAYVEGLIAYYEEKYEEARAKAREALAQSKWLYEAEVLVGNTHHAEGARFKHDMKESDVEKMKASWKPAEEAYLRATAIARSDPLAHEARCELWMQTALSDMVNSLESAKSACEVALAASSRRSAARRNLAMILSNASRWIESRDEKLLAANRALELAELDVKDNPNDAMAHYILAEAWKGEMACALDAASDTLPAIENAILAYSRALELDPEFLWAMSDLGGMYRNKVTEDFLSGKDFAPSFEEALKQFDRADELAPPGFNNLLLGRYSTLESYIDALVWRGQSPNAFVERALKASQAAFSSARTRRLNLLKIYVIKARYELLAGADPSASVELALKEAEAGLTASPSEPEIALYFIAMFNSIAAQYAVQRGDDPEPALRKAREACQKIPELSTKNKWYNLEFVDIELTAIQWAMKRGNAREAHFKAAFARIEPLLSEEHPSYMTPSQKMAEILALRAARLHERGQSPAEDIERGLAMTERNLTRNPRHAHALAARGGLYLVRAKSARDPAAQKDAARLARASFTEAFKNNPLLEREHGPAAREAARLEGESQSKGEATKD